ncbi:MAG: domain S-box/diguanylate cyclase protein [Lachnospiraceae bacterium]|jgi:diguanylate cyclase (GGDEF)-like protein/PAS domain S-box-containing protein|nr:domain S-box/diguanylate cyclase protein [Lachnospiraceae bacterium]
MVQVGEEFYRNMLENIYDGVYFVDYERKITFWNKGAERITGFSANEVVNQLCFRNILNHISDEGEHLCIHGCPLHNTILTGDTAEIHIYLHHKDGHRLPITVKAVPIYEGNNIIGAVEIFTDDSDKHNIIKDMEELKIIAMMDQLTELPNRRYIDTFIFSKMNEFTQLGIPFGIAFMDIDHFKSFNDTYGHDIGDEVLKMVAKTLKSNIRSTDLIGRWGGEEFMAVISHVDKEKLLSITQKVKTLVENSVLRKDNKELNVTISIGATMSQENDTIESMIKRADTLLYQSKNQGRNQITMV